MKRECHCPRVRHTHGTDRAYVCDRCRCLLCRAAHARRMTAYRGGGTWRETGYMPRCGVQRRLRGLSYIGRTSEEIAAELGMSSDCVVQLRADSKHPGVSMSTHEAVAALYDRWWDQPRTDAKGKVCATLASRFGYLPPLAWDDDDIDCPSAEPQTGRGESPKELHLCGTPAAARRHYRNLEPLDPACRAAYNRYNAESRARRKKGAA